VTRELRPILPWWTIKHGFYAEMGGYRVTDGSTGQKYCFRGLQLAWLHKQKLISIPEISTQDMDDRSDADALAKFMVCVHSGWFLISSCARFQQHLHLTTLELDLLPYVVLTWVFYLFWWSKPLQLSTYTEVSVQNLATASLISLAEATLPVRKEPYCWRPVPTELHARGWEFCWMDKPWDMKRLKIKNPNPLIPSELHNRVRRTMAESCVADWYRVAINDGHPSESDYWDDLVIYVSGLFIFCFPLLAWNWHFPTQVERMIWRVTAVTSGGAITAWVPLAFMLSFLEPGTFWKELPYYILTVIVGASRFYLVVESFIGIRWVPEGVFKTVSRSSYFPHVT